MLRYSTTDAVTVDQFRDVLVRSTLGERRPLGDAACLQGMIDHANLVASCWDGDRLVGVARCLTDFSYCCYMADLAVDRDHQRFGIGRKLITLVQDQLGPHTKIILLAAPAAVEYYPHIGFEHHPQAWILERQKQVGAHKGQRPVFEIHPRLREDAHVLGRLSLSRLLLHRNAEIPWFILVPEVAERELCQLSSEPRRRLTGEMDAVGRFVLEQLGCDKLNVAAIGNVVPQLHVHVVGRRVGDPCWPGVVWGHLKAASAYTEHQLAGMKERLGQLPGFQAAG